jgi:F-type H+-transporting ATPase subunit delta
MSVRRIAQRYATALADLVLAKGEQAVVQEELKALSELMQTAPELRQVFANPAVTKPQKQKILAALVLRARPSPLTENFLRVLLKNERLHHLAEIYEVFAEELDSRLGIVTAGVLTARPLTPTETSQIAAQLEKLTGKRIRLRAMVDPEIIGGVVAWIGSEVYDGSIHTQLEKIGEDLRR